MSPKLPFAGAFALLIALAVSAAPAATLSHRYSFDSDTSDSVGGVDGVLVGGATVSGGQLVLNNSSGSGAGATSMQFSSTIGIGSNFGATGVTIEAWYTDSGSGTWSKLFTFGAASAGQELAFTNSRANTSRSGLDRNGNTDLSFRPSLNEEHHLVISVAADGTTNLWIDGAREFTDLSTNPLSNVTTTVESIGSTAWNDPGHVGSVNEFRIWSGELNPTEVAENLAAGPDNLTGGGPIISAFTASPQFRYEGETSTLGWSIDDSNVAGALSVEIRDPGGTVIHSAASPTGSFPVVVGDTGGTVQALTYTLDAWDTSDPGNVKSKAVDLDADPGIPTAEGQSLQTVTVTPLAVTLSGNDPNSAPDPTLSFSVEGQPSSGMLTGSAPDLTYTANPGFTGTDSFTFKSSDGKYDSPLATVNIEVVPAPSAPTAIELSATTISDNVILGGLVAVMSSSDVNAGDSHTYSLVAGVGDGDNASFSIVGNQLRAAASFDGEVGNQFSIRLRTVDSGGLAYEESFDLLVVETSDDLVINEIHFNPPENPVRQEFIELYNPSDSAADLTGWRLSGAVDFSFPNGTVIPAGGYLVIAEDPATLLATLNATAIGPFSGSLSSDGETVRLRDPNDNVVDLVDYKVGFPWPVAADGGGASIELINPELDNSLGSSWRASIPQSLLDEAVLLDYLDTGWSWRPGTSEASDPVGDWRDQAFVEDGTWNPGAQAPLGYGSVTGVPLNTTISGMQNNYRCIFLRNTFQIAPGEIPSQLRLNYTADDGIVVWINGVEVERQRFDPGEDPTVDDLASTTGTEGAYESETIINPGAFLIEGTNTIAVQVFNATLGSSDLGFDLQILRPGEEDAEPIPSPGAPNTAFATNAPPNIRKVDHTPQAPASSDAVLITAKVTDPDGVQSVTCRYQVVAPGSYVPSKLPLPIVSNNINTTVDRPDNPEYDPGSWAVAVMNDSGLDGDAVAGDDLWSVTLPAQAHRSLVRYRIRVADGLDLSTFVPYPDDASLNFAYFVYDGVPAYEGTDAATMANTLPVYHLITREEDWDECYGYSGSDRINQGTQARFFYNWSGTLVYDGKVYDNIRYRLRGANGRYQGGGKRSMRLRFNDGYYLEARDQFGKRYDQRWRTLTLGKGQSNRGTQTFGLNEAINYYLFQQWGVPAANPLYIHWRVIDDAAEAPDRWRGDFRGLHFVSETYDVRFLEEHGLEKGNLYKLINQTGDWRRQQRYQAASAPDNGSDHNWIEGSLNGNSPAATTRARVDLERWNRSHAMVEAIRHYDYWPSANKNMVYYFAPEYTTANDFNGQLWILPWDTDSSWGPSYNSGHDAVYNALFDANGGGSDNSATPELWPEYYNAVRELRDLVWQPDQLNPVIDEFAAFIAPLEAADAARWKGAPGDAGNYNHLSGPGTSSLAAYVQDMKNFAFNGGSSWPGGNDGAIPQSDDSGLSGQQGRDAYLDYLQGRSGESGEIPATPTISYTGSANYPTNGISFQCSSFSDPQGAGSFAAMEWRIAQIHDPAAPNHDPEARFKMEVEADWESGELATFAASIEIPTTAVRSGLTYRARVRHQDSTGRWSHWSAPHEFTTTLPDLSEYLAGLVVSEVMYHPGDPGPAELAAGFDDDDYFEYIELKNVGATTLDLQDLRFTKGVDFDFLGSAITTLAPGEFVLVVKDLAAFELRYGAGLPVAGAWESSDKLDNGGEQVKLSFGAGDPVRDFVYDDRAPWPTSPDGAGPSLTLQQPETVPDHGLAASWAPSNGRGSPGADDPDTSYLTWREDVFGAGDPPGSGELEDPDCDGLVNLIEYAAGTDPLSASEVPAAVIGTHLDGGDEFLTITYRRRTDRPDVVWGVEVSTDLAIWDRGAGFTVQVGDPLDHGDGTESVTERSLVPIGGGVRQYLRALVEVQ